MRSRRRRLVALPALVGVSAALGAGAVVGWGLPGGDAAPAREVLTAPTPSPSAAAPAVPVTDDGAAVSTCARAVAQQTGKAVDRSVDLALASVPAGWRVTVVVESGQSLDCDVHGSGRLVVVPTSANDGDVRSELGLEHLACRTVEPALLASSTGAPDAGPQAALDQALPHLAPETVDAVVGPHRSQSPLDQLKAVYRSCLDRGWGGNRALL